MPAEEKALAPPPHGDLSWDEAACRARLAATTPLPWQYYGDVICGVTAQCSCPADHARTLAGVAMEPDRPHEAHDIVSGVAECDVDDETIPDFEQYKRDLQFIAHAPADLGAALAVLDAARAKIDEADGVIAAATAAITQQLNRAVTAERECDRLRARLEECRLTGAGESGAVAESLQLRSERDHWQRKWAEGREEIGRLRAALIRIQEWDCLNPPRWDLLHDLPWLRRLVDEALRAGHRHPDVGGRP